MIWPILLLVGLVVFGSVYWLKPSPRDTRLAALRLDAIKKKLQVRQFTFKPDSAKTGIRDEITGTTYTMMNPSKRDGGVLLWRVCGQAGWDTNGLPEGIAWHDQGSAADAELLTKLLPELKDDLMLLEVFSNRVTMMAAERKSATADAYEAFLQQVLASVDR